MLRASPRGVGARGQTTLALSGIDRHYSLVLGEFLMLPRRLYPSVSALGRWNGRAIAVDNRSLLKLTLVHP